MTTKGTATLVLRHTEDLDDSDLVRVLAREAIAQETELTAVTAERDKLRELFNGITVGDATYHILERDDKSVSIYYTLPNEAVHYVLFDSTALDKDA